MKFRLPIAEGQTDFHHNPGNAAWRTIHGLLRKAGAGQYRRMNGRSKSTAEAESITADIATK